MRNTCWGDGKKGHTISVTTPFPPPCVTHQLRKLGMNKKREGLFSPSLFSFNDSFACLVAVSEKKEGGGMAFGVVVMEGRNKERVRFLFPRPLFVDSQQHGIRTLGKKYQEVLSPPLQMPLLPIPKHTFVSCHAHQ